MFYSNSVVDDFISEIRRSNLSTGEKDGLIDAFNDYKKMTRIFRLIKSRWNDENLNQINYLFGLFEGFGFFNPDE